MHRFTPALPRLLAVSLVALAALLALPNAGACPVEVIPMTQELFRDAVRVYEAVALDDSFHFQVEEVWRGPEVETVHLPWAARQVGACAGQGPAVPGRRYLITIECSDPIEGDTFDCPSLAEEIEYADDRLRYLKEAYPLAPGEVADALRGWLDGSWTTDELASWVAEMKIIGQVDDWIDLGGFLGSPTLGAVGMTDFFMTGAGDLRLARECRDRVLRQAFIPRMLELLTEEDLDRKEAAADAADEAYETFWDACEEAFVE